jgi:hypothetical protein
MTIQKLLSDIKKLQDFHYPIIQTAWKKDSVVFYYQASYFKVSLINDEGVMEEWDEHPHSGSRFDFKKQTLSKEEVIKKLSSIKDKYVESAQSKALREMSKKYIEDLLKN